MRSDGVVFVWPAFNNYRSRLHASLLGAPCSFWAAKVDKGLHFSKFMSPSSFVESHLSGLISWNPIGISPGFHGVSSKKTALFWQAGFGMGGLRSFAGKTAANPLLGKIVGLFQMDSATNSLKVTRVCLLYLETP